MSYVIIYYITEPTPVPNKHDITQSVRTVRNTMSRHVFGNICFVYYFRVDKIEVLIDVNFLIRVISNGTVSWDLPAVVETHCDVDITYYPADIQKCDVELVSWAYNIHEISIQIPDDDIDRAELRPNGEWDVVDTGHLMHDIHECCPQETYRQVKFFITFKRKSIFYIMNVILPVTTLSFLSSIVFALPMASGERVSYALTVLLSYAVFLSIITSTIPTTSNHVSLLGKHEFTSLGCSTLY